MRRSRYRSVNENGLVVPAAAGAVTVQRKLTVGATNDPMEHQADRMADKVMRMPEAPFVQRCACGGAYDDDHVHLKPLSNYIQAKSDGSGTVSNSLAGKIQSSKGGGSPISKQTKSFMESRFGHDFSDVKVHTNNNAAQMSNELKAQAFTTGRDIYFNSGKYAPETSDGKRLLAHELTHVIQQSGGNTVRRQPKKPENDYKSCTSTQQGMIDPVLTDARKKVEDAQRAVAIAWGHPDKIDPHIKQLLLDNFHTVDKGDLRKILSKYVSLGQSLASGISLQCENSCPKDKVKKTVVCGYAYNTQVFGGSGPIHICFDPQGCDFTASPANDRIALIIHEAAHRHTGVDDKVYKWEAKYATLSPDDAMDNADSYAWFATLL